MTTAHTATPPFDFVEGKSLLHIETAYGHPHGAGLPVCSLPKSKRDLAEFIVRACNAHDDLVKALRNLLERHEALLNSGDLGECDAENEGEVIDARAALAKASHE